MIFKRERPTMARLIAEKCSNGDGNAQKNSTLKIAVVRWDHIAWGMQGGDTMDQGASSPLGLTLECVGSGWILPPLGRGPTKSPRLANTEYTWLRSTVNGQPHPVWKATARIQKGKEISSVG